MDKLTKATEKFYNLLKEKKATYSEGKFVEEKKFVATYDIPQEAIVEAHNEGNVLDVYAHSFIKRPDIVIPDLIEKQKFGQFIMPHGYALIDLDVPKAVLYGQINMSSGKRDIPGEHLKALIVNQKREDFYSHTSELSERRERARLQKGISPRERIRNARKVIECADLKGSLEAEYRNQKKEIEEGLEVAKQILDGIHSGRWFLELKEKPGLSEEHLRKFGDLYSDGYDVSVSSKRLGDASENLARIESCRDILERYGLIQEDAANAILHTPLKNLSQAWIEVK